MERLYAEYGQLMVQLEILQNRINEVKGKIAAEMQKPQTPKQEKKDGEQECTKKD